MPKYICKDCNKQTVIALMLSVPHISVDIWVCDRCSHTFTLSALLTLEENKRIHVESLISD